MCNGTQQSATLSFPYFFVKSDLWQACQTWRGTLDGYVGPDGDFLDRLTSLWRYQNVVSLCVNDVPYGNLNPFHPSTFTFTLYLW